MILIMLCNLINTSFFQKYELENGFVMVIVIMKLLKSVLLWFKGELYIKEEEKILKLKLKLAKGEKLTLEEEKMIL